MIAPRPIEYVEDDGIARITLDRPPLNILDLGMIEDLNAALDRAAARPRLAAVVLAAMGRTFSAGVAVEDHLGPNVRPMLEAFHAVFRRLRALDCITIAAVHGAALGGGAELAAFCDVVIAADSATLGQPEITRGVFPPIAALHYRTRVGFARAVRLITSGEVLTAAEALRIGLVDRVVPAGRLAAAIDAECARYRALSSCVLRLAKRAIRDTEGLGFDEGLAMLEELYHDELMSTDDAEEGLRAFVEKRPPLWSHR
jgi:cyclohexa-1,5-dienecarbonyl-CoA hydratase